MTIFDTIILLTGDVEQPALTAALLAQAEPLAEIGIPRRGEKASRRMFQSMFDLPGDVSDWKLIESVRANIR